MTADAVPSPRIPVESTAIASVNYYPHIQMLELEFVSGSIYLYFDVPADVYKSLIRADSTGRYFHYNVRGNYRFVRVK